MWKRYFLEDGTDDGTAGGAGGSGAGTGGVRLPGDGAAAGAAGAASGAAGAGAAGNGDGAQGGSGAGAGNAGAAAAAGNTDQIKFPEKWRDGLGNGDPKKVERLSRYATPQAVADALLSVQERISRGELRSNVPFPDKGTVEEQNAWRKDQGIPDAPDKYEIKLSGDKAIPENDKPLVNEFLKSLHVVNASPAVASAALDSYYNMVAKTTQLRAEKDAQTVQQVRDNLIADMGLPEFKQNQNLVEGMLQLMPEKVRDLFKMGRLANGDPIYGGNADVFKGLAEWARKINPVTAVVPGAGENTAGAIDTEISKIEKTMREDRNTYNKDQKMQDRYLELLDARTRVKQ